MSPSQSKPSHTASTPFAKFLAEWESTIRARSRSYARSNAWSEDFAQDARIRLYKEFRRASLEGKPLDAPYVRRAIDNSMRDSRRNEMRQFRSLSPEVAWGEDVDQFAIRGAADPERRVEITAWFATLGPDDRQLAIRAWCEQATQRQIAADLGVAQRTVTNRIERLKESATEWFKDRGED